MRTKESILRDLAKAKGLNYVGTRGDPNAKVLLVGEAPGSDEDRLGLPFVGASGKELGRMLRDAGWSGYWIEPDKGSGKLFTPKDTMFTNVFKVRPPDNKLDRLPELGIPLDFFIASFFEELRMLKPSIIIATGNTSLGNLCPDTLGKDAKARIGTYRGSLLTSELLDWSHYVIPCYHPAFILREWKERPVGVLCLERAREEYEYLVHNRALQPLPQRALLLQPSYDNLYPWLRTCVEPTRKRVSIDIELLNGWPIVWGVANSPTDAVSFSLWDYTDAECTTLWRLLNDILRNNLQVGQNYIQFDCTWHEWLGFEPDLQLFNSQIEDTMILHHILWPELPHKLEFLGMQYTREPYWKDEGRKWKGKDIKKLMHYNALDAACTFEIWEAMQAELVSRA